MCVSLTGQVGAVSLLEDAVGDLLAGCRLVDVAVEPPQGVVLDDPAHQLTGLACRRGRTFNRHSCGIHYKHTVSPLKVHRGFPDRTQCVSVCLCRYLGLVT